MRIKKIGVALVVIVFGICAVCWIKEKYDMVSRPQMLVDYPNSVWYSKETGYMIDMGEGQQDGLLAVQYEDSKKGYYIFCDNDRYWIRYGHNYVGAKFKTKVSQDNKGTWLVLSDFSSLGKETSKSKKITDTLFRKYEKIIFQKVPKQQIVEHSNSVWKSEKLGYTITIPKENELKDEETAEVSVEYLGKKETYEMSEELDYNLPVGAGICYYPDKEGMNQNSLCFNILITKEDGDLYMKLFDFEDLNCIGEDSKKRNRELFMKYGEIVFKRVK